MMRYIFLCNVYTILYRQTSNISRTLVGNTIVDHFRCISSIACRRCSSYILTLNFKPGFNGLGTENCKTRRETLNFWNLVRVILEVWRYSDYDAWHPVSHLGVQVIVVKDLPSLVARKVVSMITFSGAGSSCDVAVITFPFRCITMTS